MNLKHESRKDIRVIAALDMKLGQFGRIKSNNVHADYNGYLAMRVSNNLLILKNGILLPLAENKNTDIKVSLCDIEDKLIITQTE